VKRAVIQSLRIDPKAPPSKEVTAALRRTFDDVYARHGMIDALCAVINTYLDTVSPPEE